MFGPVSKAVPGSRSDRWFGCQPWTANSYEKLLNLAFVYPWLFLVFSVSLRDEEPDISYSIVVTVGAIAGYLVSLGVKHKVDSKVERIWLRSLLMVISVAVAIVVVVVVAVAVVGFSPDASALVFIGAFAGAFAGVGVGAFFAAFFVAISGAVDDFFASTGFSFDTITDADIAAVAATVTEADIVAVLVASVISAAFAILFALFFIGSLNYIRYKMNYRLDLYYSYFSLSIVTISFILLMYDHAIAASYLILFLLPVFNAPLDWLSLGVTRGLLLHIARGRHQSLSNLAWALIDVGLALVFLIAVAVSSYMALLIAKALSPNSIYSTGDLRDSLLGGDDLSIGIWLMLASTLLPTFLHFLVALLAFVSLPFSREKASETADKLQSARDEVLRRINEDTNQSASDVPVDAYARRWAMAYFGVSWPVVFVLWIILVSFLSYVIYKVMQWMYLTLLPAVW